MGVGRGKKSFVSGGGCRGEESWQRLPWEKKEGGGGNNKKSKGKEGFSLMAGQWEGNRLHTDKRKEGGVRCQDKEGGPPPPPLLFFHPSETEKRAEEKDHPLGTNGANYLFLSFFFCEVQLDVAVEWAWVSRNRARSIFNSALFRFIVPSRLESPELDGEALSHGHISLFLSSIVPSVHLTEGGTTAAAASDGHIHRQAPST